MQYIRRACFSDSVRLAEIEIFNYRLNFYPIFLNDQYYFKELQVSEISETMRGNPVFLSNTFVFDDGVIKGFIYIDGKEIKKLFVEPVLQGNGIGTALLSFAVEKYGVDSLWALEKNSRAISFYIRHGFCVSDEKRHEDDTDEYLVRLRRNPARHEEDL